MDPSDRDDTHGSSVDPPREPAAKTRARARADARPKLPALTRWLALPGSPESEISYDDSDWHLSLRPRSMVELGNGSNAYGWYRAHIPCGVAMETSIHFSDCADMLTLFVNGARIGRTPARPKNRISPWPADFAVHLRVGCNAVAVLADNLGLTEGAKGILGDVTLGDGRLVKNWRFMGRLEVEREGLTQPGALSRRRWLEPGFYEQARADRLLLWAAEFELPAAAISPAYPILLRMDGMSKGAMWLNGHSLGRYRQNCSSRGHSAPEACLAPRNLLVIADEEGKPPTQVRLIYDAEGGGVEGHGQGKQPIPPTLWEEGKGKGYSGPKAPSGLTPSLRAR